MPPFLLGVIYEASALQIESAELSIFAWTYFVGGFMYRNRVNKRRSAKTFRKNVGRTKGINMSGSPPRGGRRL